MIRWELRRAIDKFERDGDSHASHTRHMIDTSPRPTWVFSRVTDLLAAAVIAGFANAGPAAAGNPFFAATPPAPVYLAWSLAWIVGVLALAIWSFRSREV